MHAKTMLLVHDGKREIAEFHLLLEQRMRANKEVEIAGGKPLFGSIARWRLAWP